MGEQLIPNPYSLDSEAIRSEGFWAENLHFYD